MFLILLTVTAVFLDFRYDRIPNWLILSGLAIGWCVQLIQNGTLGILWFLGGAGLPVLAGALIYYFRMVGAGDIKLLSAAGCFMGPGNAAACMVFSVLAGGAFAVLLVWKHHNLMERIQYFCSYVTEMSVSGKWKPYLSEENKEGRIHFSIAVLAAVLLYAGGVY